MHATTGPHRRPVGVEGAARHARRKRWAARRVLSSHSPMHWSTVDGATAHPSSIFFRLAFSFSPLFFRCMGIFFDRQVSDLSLLFFSPRRTWGLGAKGRLCVCLCVAVARCRRAHAADKRKQAINDSARGHPIAKTHRQKRIVDKRCSSVRATRQRKKRGVRRGRAEGARGGGAHRVVRPSDKGDATQSNKKKKTRARRGVAQAHQGKGGKVVFDHRGKKERKEREIPNDNKTGKRANKKERKKIRGKKKKRL